MITKDKKKEENEETVKIPILNIRMMTDEEWNRLAYKNWLERIAKKEIVGGGASV